LPSLRLAARLTSARVDALVATVQWTPYSFVRIVAIPRGQIQPSTSGP
jgi:hypothetical protein